MTDVPYSKLNPTGQKPITTQGGPQLIPDSSGGSVVRQITDTDIIRVIKRFGFFGSIPPIHRVFATTEVNVGAYYVVPFFTADRPYQILEVVERHEKSDTSDPPPRADILKVPSGTTNNGGTSILATQINLGSPAATNVTPSLSTTFGRLLLVRGDSLCGTLASGSSNAESMAWSVRLKAI